MCVFLMGSLPGAVVGGSWRTAGPQPARTGSGHCNTSALAGSTTLSAEGVYLHLT